MSASVAIRVGAATGVPGRPGALLEAGSLLLMLAVSLGLRVYDLEGASASFPDLSYEGVRAEQLLLLAHGYQPFREAHSTQSSILLPLLYPFYLLFGETLGAIRLGVGLISLVGLLGVWWAARQVAGAVGGLAAVFLLAASPAYLEGSRRALAEVPSLVPGLLAIGCALRWRRGGGPGWLYGAAVLATVAVLIKPVALSVGLPIGVLALTRPGARPRDLGISMGLALGVTVLAVLFMDPARVWEQIVQYRHSAIQQGGWELPKSVKEIVTGPFRSQPGLLVLGIPAALLLLRVDWRIGLGLVLWPLATIGLLLFYHPMQPKHLVYLYPPLALLGGAGLGQAARLARRESRDGLRARLMTVGLAALLAALPLGSLSGVGSASAADDAPEDADLHVFDRDAVRSLQLLTTPDQFVLTDHPYLAATARRMVPPSMVDPSVARIRAGVLTDSDVIKAAEAFDTQAVLIWADRLRRLSGLPPWLDRNYVAAHVFGHRNVKDPRRAKDRTLYLPRDADLDLARERLETTLTTRETVNFDGKLRLLGAAVSADEVTPREQFTVTVGFLALAPMSSDYHVTLEFMDPSGEIRHEQKHALDGAAAGTSQWSPSRWLFRTFAVRPEQESPSGEYRLKLRIVDKAGLPLRGKLGADSSQLTLEQSVAVVLGTVQVR